MVTASSLLKTVSVCFVCQINFHHTCSVASLVSQNNVYYSVLKRSLAPHFLHVSVAGSVSAVFEMDRCAPIQICGEPYGE